MSLYILTDIRTRYASLNIARPFSLSYSYLLRQVSQLIPRIGALLGRSTTSTQIIKAFEEMIVKERADETYLQYFFSLSYFQSLDVIGAAVMHVREKPDGNPPALVDPKLIGGKPTHSTSSIRSLRSIVEELDPYNIPGFRLGPLQALESGFADEDRYLYHEITFRFNATVFQHIFDFHLEEIDKIKDLQGMFPVIVMQPVSEISRRGNEKNGGNPFGFSDSDGPLCGT
jgi:hypothetical protein